MRIKSLKLQNIRSYVEETIEFPQGSVLLAGDIGAGKSTILLAIEYALFGTKRGELEPTSLLRHGSHAGKIELIFDINSNTVKITRILKRTSVAIKQEAGFIVINNTRIDATPVELRSRVMDLLGYPKDSQPAKDLIYRYTVFTPQEQMRHIIYENKENRLNTLRKIFNIDKYKKIKENAQFIAKELRTKKRILEETLIDTSALVQKQKSFQEQLSEKKAQYAQHFLQLQQIQEKEASVKKHIETAEAQHKKIQELRQNYALHTQELKKNSVQQTALQLKQQHVQQQKELLQRTQVIIPEKPSEKSQSDLEQDKESAERSVQELQQTHAIRAEQKKAAEEKLLRLQQTITDRIQTLSRKNEYEQQRQELDAIISHKQGLISSIVDAERHLKTCHEHKAGAELRKNNAQNTVENIQSMDICTLCLQHIHHEHKEIIVSDQTKHIHAAEKELEHITTQEQNFCKNLEIAKKQLDVIIASEQKKASVLTFLENFAEKEKELQQKQHEYNALQQQIQSFIPVDATLFAEAQQKVVHLKLLLQKQHAWDSAVQEYKNRQVMIQDKEAQQKEIETDIQQLIHEQKTLQQTLSMLEQQLVQFKDAEIILAQHKQNLQHVHAHEKQCEIILATLGKEQQHLAQQCENIQAEIDTQNTLLEKIKKLNASSQWIEEYFVPLVQTMEKHVLLQVHSSFNQFFTEWFSMLMGDNMSARLDENFAPVIEQNGYDADVVHLSGGEKTAVSLAYRLALNKVLNNFISTITTKDFIILDEPTEGFSSEQLDTVREVLDALGLQQVILVSHEQKIESFAEHVIRIEKHGHVSKVV